jgi:hypothetical protein
VFECGCGYLVWLSAAPAVASALGRTQNDPGGRWEGAIAIMGMRLEMAVTFTQVEGAWSAVIDIPQQRARGWR